MLNKKEAEELTAFVSKKRLNMDTVNPFWLRSYLQSDLAVKHLKIVSHRFETFKYLTLFYNLSLAVTASASTARSTASDTLFETATD